jgi:hypothetical protein
MNRAKVDQMLFWAAAPSRPWTLEMSRAAGRAGRLGGSIVASSASYSEW